VIAAEDRSARWSSVGAPLLAAALLVLTGTARAELARPRNHWLVDGVSAMTHLEPTQQDSVAIPGPAGVGDVAPERIQRIAGEPARAHASNAQPILPGPRPRVSRGSLPMARARSHGVTCA